MLLLLVRAFARPRALQLLFRVPTSCLSLLSVFYVSVFAYVAIAIVIVTLPVSSISFPLSLFHFYCQGPSSNVSRFLLSQLAGYPVKDKFWERRKRAELATAFRFYFY